MYQYQYQFVYTVLKINNLNVSHNYTTLYVYKASIFLMTFMSAQNDFDKTALQVHYNVISMFILWCNA